MGVTRVAGIRFSSSFIRLATPIKNCFARGFMTGILRAVAEFLPFFPGAMPPRRESENIRRTPVANTNLRSVFSAVILIARLHCTRRDGHDIELAMGQVEGSVPCDGGHKSCEIKIATSDDPICYIGTNSLPRNISI